MTIALAGNAAGGVLLAGGAPAVNVSTASGLPFMKNKLINGEVTRINQRGVANWAAVANGAYGYDRWKKIDSSNMTQIIEAGNFRPSTVHTLSGIGVTTQQITSPASGNWTLPNIPITATNVQVEEGLVATPFEVRHIGFELALCQRYFESGRFYIVAYQLGGGGFGQSFPFKVNKRATPIMSTPTVTASTNVTNPGLSATEPTSYQESGTATATGVVVHGGTFFADAEL